MRESSMRKRLFPASFLLPHCFIAKNLFLFSIHSWKLKIIGRNRKKEKIILRLLPVRSSSMITKNSDRLLTICLLYLLSMEMYVCSTPNICIEGVNGILSWSDDSSYLLLLAEFYENASDFDIVWLIGWC